MLTLHEARGPLADDDARRACAAMDHDVRAALRGTPDQLGAEIASDAHAAYERSLMEHDRASWRQFYEAVRQVVAASRLQPDEATPARAALQRLRAFLEENSDLAAP